MRSLPYLLSDEAFASPRVQKLLEFVASPRPLRKPLLDDGDLHPWAVFKHDKTRQEQSGLMILAEILDHGVCVPGSRIEGLVQQWGRTQGKHTSLTFIQVLLDQSLPGRNDRLVNFCDFSTRLA